MTFTTETVQVLAIKKVLSISAIHHNLLWGSIETNFTHLLQVGI